MLINSYTAQQQRFDIITYAVPKDRTINKKAETVTFTKDVGAKGF